METRVIEVTGSGLSAPFEMVVPDEGSLWRDYDDTGHHEPKTTQVLVNIFTEHPDATFWDVGSFYGYFSLLAAQSLSEAAGIHVLEPDPDHFRIIETNNRRYADGRLTTVHTALGAQSGDNQTTGDTYRNGHEDPDVIKIDVDGDEATVLEGLSATIRDCRPCFLVEIHSAEQYGVKLERLIDRLPTVAYNYAYCPNHRDNQSPWIPIDAIEELPTVSRLAGQDYMLACFPEEADSAAYLE